MNDALHAKPKVIQGTPLIVLCHRTDSSLERRCPEHENASEVEVIPQRTLLAIDKRMSESACNTVLTFSGCIVIRIQHVGLCILGYAQNAIQSKHAHFKRFVLSV